MTEKDLTVYIQSSTQLNTMSLTLLDILLDETLVYGTIYVPKACFATVSALNRRLPAKQAYELVLRLAEQFPVCLSGESSDDTKPLCGELTSADFCVFEFHEAEPGVVALLTDCYIISRYKKLLLEQQLFDSAIESILLAADAAGCKDQVLAILPDMLSEKGRYLDYYLGSAPFLIYTGDTTCYNILSVFAKELGDALRRMGHLVEYFDLSKQAPAEVATLTGRKFQAVIGIQSYMFSVRLANNIDFLHDLIIGPKYNFVFDHPIRFEAHLRETPKELTILTPDRNYASFANTYYPVKARFLPPGGIISHHLPTAVTADSSITKAVDNSRIYDVTFIASYDNFTMERLKEVHALPRKDRFLVNRVWLLIRKNPALTVEAALKMALSHSGNAATTEDYSAFFALYHKLRSHLFCISDYYRYQVLKTILDAGIRVDVFGTSWAYSSLKEHPCFIWHNKDLSTGECLAIWQQSKIALNVMSWHKDAITERILNSMLQGAVVITERNPYICEEFKESDELLLYDLKNLEALPTKVRTLLSDSVLRTTFAKNGCKKALQSHTWDIRANQLLAIIDETIL